MTESYYLRANGEKVERDNILYHYIRYLKEWTRVTREFTRFTNIRLVDPIIWWQLGLSKKGYTQSQIEALEDEVRKEAYEILRRIGHI